MLKVAYISPVYFSNVDISFLNKLYQYCDVDYYALVGHSGKGCAINLKRCPSVSGIYKAENFEELSPFAHTINLKQTKIVFRKAHHSWHYSNFAVTRQLSRMLKKGNYDVIHCTDVFRYYEWELFKFRNIIVLSVHDPFLHSSMYTRIVELYRHICFRAFSRFLVFNSQQKQQFIDTYHLQKKQVFTSALSVYSYLKTFPLTPCPDYKYTLFFGKIRGYKGLEYLFPAMEHVHSKYPNFKLIVAGDGEYYFDIEKYRNCDYIIILNRFFEDCELASLLAYADFVVCPYNDATQSGVVMAAYAFEKPCIVTRTGGLPEMVGNGKFGTIVPPRNTEKLAEAICDLLEHPEKLSYYSKKIQTEYTKGFKSWKHIAEDVYKNVYLAEV